MRDFANKSIPSLKDIVQTGQATGKDHEFVFFIVNKKRLEEFYLKLTNYCEYVSPE